jgi:hypothetical protein
VNPDEIVREVVQSHGCFVVFQLPAEAIREEHVSIRSLFDYLKGRETLDEFLRQFPSVTRDQAIATLELACEALLNRPPSE